jgi:hypothetical protein
MYYPYYVTLGREFSGTTGWSGFWLANPKFLRMAKIQKLPGENIFL